MENNNLGIDIMELSKNIFESFSSKMSDMAKKHDIPEPDVLQKFILYISAIYLSSHSTKVDKIVSASGIAGHALDFAFKDMSLFTNEESQEQNT